ncbi:hypothetical protein ACFOD7_18235 [Paracoccus fontiphilus]|uniref:Uncharacterized protein n=1 Tax=Paracoccus fontiphilus TaxID=1815556 RepID=A0ABV7IJN6_9RHOB
MNSTTCVPGGRPLTAKAGLGTVFGFPVVQLANPFHEKSIWKSDPKTGAVMHVTQKRAAVIKRI